MTEVELFVAVLGASNYTFAEATRTQQVPDFAASVARDVSVSTITVENARGAPAHAGAKGGAGALRSGNATMAQANTAW